LIVLANPKGISMSKVQYSTDKTPVSKPPVIIGTYESHGTKTTPPNAAVLNVGIRGQDRVEHACERRREHNAALSDPGRAGDKKQSPLS
jgi:hypothetical protein